MAKLTRTFLALPLTTAQRRDTAALIKQLRAFDSGCVRWVSEDKLHITLAFLGDIDPNQVIDVCRIAAEIADDTGTISWQLEGVGAFPNLDHPSVLWVGASDDGIQIIELQSRLQQRLEKIGFPAEARKFHPHVTLGRLPRRKRVPENLRAGLQNHLGWQGKAAECVELHVLGSNLGSREESYPILARCPLAGE